MPRMMNTARKDERALRCTCPWREAGAALLALSAVACSKPSAVAQEPAAASAAQAAAAPAAPLSAQLGQPAPDFTLPDLDGKPVSLAQFHGKPVVLEWFNPGCPFVRAAHTMGSLKGLAAS